MKKLKDDNKLQLNERIILIYKCGDDIRQDLLTLQLI